MKEEDRRLLSALVDPTLYGSLFEDLEILGSKRRA
jgi:hypothetical protein